MNDQTKNAILERVPKWLASVALLMFMVLLVISFLTDKRISWSPFGFVSDANKTVGTNQTPIPKGAIIAFADAPDGLIKRKCSDFGDDWGEFEAANGRVILGAGEHYGKTFRSGEYGGEYEVSLGLENIPKHNHTHQRQKDVAGGCGLSGCGFHTEYPTFNTGDAGGDKDGNTVPHNNLPPYIVLTYCKKL